MAEGNPSMMESAEAGLQPRIIVQGGLYTAMKKNNETEREYMDILKEAARKGYAILKENGSAVEAVKVAVYVLEESTSFNAGHGAFLNEKKEVECDAMIMDGYNFKAGAVAAVRHIPHPVLLSEKIMEESKHCFLCADGALEFALKHGIEVEAVNGREFKFPSADEPNPAVDQMDTVSAVAIDCRGYLACATSSGGIPGKEKSRIGDAPLIGCGGYANRFGAATTCGHGESIIKTTVAREIVNNIERREKCAQVAAENALHEAEMKLSQGGKSDPYIGVIAIDNKGNFGIASINTELIPWVRISSDTTLEYGTKSGRGQCDGVENV